MRTFITRLLSLLLFIPVSPLSAREIVINEFMASNQSTLMDENGESSDWVELLNTGNDNVNLAGYGLSDSKKKPFKWIFPEIVLQPGQFLLVWCSGKDRKKDRCMGSPEVRTGLPFPGSGCRAGEAAVGNGSEIVGGCTLAGSQDPGLHDNHERDPGAVSTYCCNRRRIHGPEAPLS